MVPEEGSEPKGKQLGLLEQNIAHQVAGTKKEIHATMKNRRLM